MVLGTRAGTGFTLGMACGACDVSSRLGQLDEKRALGACELSVALGCTLFTKSAVGAVVCSGMGSGVVNGATLGRSVSVLEGVMTGTGL